MFKIRITGSENNKAEGFYSLMTTNTSIYCLENEEYICNEVAIKKLREDKIIFIILK